MRYLIACLLMAGCVPMTTVRQVHLANGTIGHSINCPGAAQNFGSCLEKAGEICGARGFNVVDQQGDAVPFSANASQFNAGRTYASGGSYGQSMNIVTRTLFVQCK